MAVFMTFWDWEILVIFFYKSYVELSCIYIKNLHITCYIKVQNMLKV